MGLSRLYRTALAERASGIIKPFLMLTNFEMLSNFDLASELQVVLDSKKSLLSVEDIALFNEIIERLRSSPTEGNSLMDQIRWVDIILRLLQFFNVFGGGELAE